MNAIAGWLTVLLLFPLTVLVVYEWILALVSYAFRPAPLVRSARPTRFLVLIPAHNEEGGIEGTLRSLEALNYPGDCYEIVVVADRCTDGTAAMVRRHRARCLERNEGVAGKGATLAWGLEESKRAGIAYEAVVIIDADTLADRDLLQAFDSALQQGHAVQQGYNYISNPWASPFTRIIAVTGVLRNARYYAGKNVLGLQGMLTGTGMCLSASVLSRHGWSAFSVGEDWEFSVDLLLAGEDIYFNPQAKTLARESQNLQQASRQRLRWASGRYAVMGNKAWILIVEGFRRRRLSLIDAAVTLLAPNYSSQASFSLLGLGISLVNLAHSTWGFTVYWAAGLVCAIAGYFLLGVLSTDAPGRALAGLLLIPVFLPWRLAIEVLGMLGYGRRHWGRMSRSNVSARESQP